MKLLSSPGQLETIYEDAKKGNARAKRVFEELETSYFPDTGRELAEKVSRPPCLVPVIRELSGWCVPDWSFLDFLSKETPAGTRLRVALLNGYMEQAHQRQLENQLVLSAMTSILGVSVVATALREAGVAANVTAASDAPGITANTLRQSELLREAAAGSRNFGLGSATRVEADAAGRAWVGDGARVASDGSTLVSQDGLRQYRPPSLKPKLGRTQAKLRATRGPEGSLAIQWTPRHRGLTYESQAQTPPQS